MTTVAASTGAGSVTVTTIAVTNPTRTIGSRPEISKAAHVVSILLRVVVHAVSILLSVQSSNARSFCKDHSHIDQYCFCYFCCFLLNESGSSFQ